MPLGKRDTSTMSVRKSKTLSTAILRVFCLVIMAKLHDSVGRYLICLSSHLKMKWQITPATIDTQRDTNMSMSIPPFCCQIGQRQQLIIP